MTKAPVNLKMTKAEAVLKLLQKGHSTKDIREQLGVSLSYVHMLKKRLAEGVEEPVETVRQTATEHNKKVKEMIEDWRAEAEAEAVLGTPCTNDCGPKPEPEVSGVGNILDARAEQYGSFMQSADTVIRIKGIMHNAVARNALHLYPDQLQALDMIATKISRIVHGNPNHLDSWIDIAGYATLVADRLQGKTR